MRHTDPRSWSVFTMISRIAVALTTCLLLLPSYNCYGSGAPSSACANLVPIHSGVIAQTSANPYSFIISSTAITADQTLQGKYTSTSFSSLICYTHWTCQSSATFWKSQWLVSSYDQWHGLRGVHLAGSLYRKCQGWRVFFSWRYGSLSARTLLC